MNEAAIVEAQLIGFIDMVYISSGVVFIAACTGLVALGLARLIKSRM